MITYSKKKLAKVAKLYDLKFVILHGSHAKNAAHIGSDCDIAVLGNTVLDSSRILQLHGDMADVFGDDPDRELDLKTLHKVDPLFRYYVVRDGVLLYGDHTAYEEFKSFAYRAYEDSRPLRELERILSLKYQRHLNALARKYA
ncbi:MAG: nucleotidyltransferase domain-containing protein [Candidatus Kerfeldbacteria bacterium]|nr:nucleotidyltransferase domain-containing protein [Candidatus Kerfeldbacteria bacterium]